LILKAAADSVSWPQWPAPMGERCEVIRLKCEAADALLLNETNFRKRCRRCAIGGCGLGLATRGFGVPVYLEWRTGIGRTDSRPS
jgi:hypothetical protein